MLSAEDKARFNELYLAIKRIRIPQFADDSAIQMGEEVKEGLEIINKAILQVSKTI